MDFRASNIFRDDKHIWQFLIRQILYVAVGVGLYFFISMLSLAYFDPGIRNVTFRPVIIILVLFGLLCGPWVGLVVGILGKGLSDIVAGWGFYWNAVLAYGLIGLFPGFVKLTFDKLRSTRNVFRALVWSALGILAGASFFSLTEARFGDLNLSNAIRGYFLPEVAGNLTVLLVLLPLSIVAITAIDQKRKS